MSFHALPVSPSEKSETKIRSKGETVRKYSIGAAPLTPEAPWT